MMKRLRPNLFVSRIRESEDPLWGLVVAAVVSGVVIVGLRWRWTRLDIGDAGIVIFNVCLGVEWGGGER